MKKRYALLVAGMLGLAGCQQTPNPTPAGDRTAPTRPAGPGPGSQVNPGRGDISTPGGTAANPGGNPSGDATNPAGPTGPQKGADSDHRDGAKGDAKKEAR